MQCSVETYMYPLHKKHKPIISDFIKKSQTYRKIKIASTEMSTQSFSTCELLMSIIFKDNKSIVFNIKIVNSDLKEIPNF